MRARLLALLVVWPLLSVGVAAGRGQDLSSTKGQDLSSTRGQDIPKPKTLDEAKQQFDVADQELNRVYKQCIAPDRTTVQSIAALKQAQQLWVQYRDGNAAAYQTGQSSRQVIKDQYYYYASTVITWSRIQELKTLFLAE